MNKNAPIHSNAHIEWKKQYVKTIVILNYTLQQCLIPPLLMDRNQTTGFIINIWV